MKQFGIPDVRKAVYKIVGNQVLVKSSKGRQKFDVNKGVVKEAYPHIFRIELDSEEEGMAKTVSYTYSDILTKDVELCLCGICSL